MSTVGASRSVPSVFHVLSLMCLGTTLSSRLLVSLSSANAHDDTDTTSLGTASTTSVSPVRSEGSSLRIPLEYTPPRLHSRGSSTLFIGNLEEAKTLEWWTND